MTTPNNNYGVQEIAELFPSLLKIEIAREFDHPPTELERVAYAVEQSDHRGTFCFAQLATAAAENVDFVHRK